MIYDFVPFHLVAEEIAKNLKNHYDNEEGKYPDLDWDTYLSQSLNGGCMVVIARTDKLIAYSVFFINRNINHKNLIEATNTGIFIDKEFRGKITLELLRKSDEYLKNIGVTEIAYISNDARIGRLLKRANYKAKHIVWSNKL